MFSQSFSEFGRDTHAPFFINGMMIFASESGSHGIPPFEKNPALSSSMGRQGRNLGQLLPCSSFRRRTLLTVLLRSTALQFFTFSFRSNLEQLAVPKIMSFLCFSRFYVFLTGMGFSPVCCWVQFFLFFLGFAFKAFISRRKCVTIKKFQVSLNFIHFLPLFATFNHFSI